MTIAIGCDPNAARLKHMLIKVIQDMGHACQDFGSEDTIYANVAFDLARAVAQGTYERGVLLCGTGIGMSIAANKVRGAFAALVYDTYSAAKAVTSNKANIMCLGALTTGDAVAAAIVQSYLNARYVTGTPSEKKAQCYIDYDNTRDETFKH